MNLPTEIFGDVIVVHTPDELDAEQGPGASLKDYLGGLERNKIVLDLDNTETISSRGLTALVDAQEQLRAEGGLMKISTTNNTTRKILEITQLDEQLEVFASMIDAVKSFRAQP